ncbi:MAG: hypothetical protein PHU61_00650 [Candidatus Absconditabacteria bacterium]|nr:hypothetical protein [Candidatus Absconditabacteria bacterium]MDD4714088.1 hypothetical protein [Candidatus Absconditabacteria bacterium]
MLLTIFSLVAFGVVLGVLYFLFYGIITLVFKPNESSFKKLQKIAIALMIAIIMYAVSVFLVNTLLINIGLPERRFGFNDITFTIGQWLQGNFYF